MNRLESGFVRLAAGAQVSLSKRAESGRLPSGRLLRLQREDGLFGWSRRVVSVFVIFWGRRTPAYVLKQGNSILNGNRKIRSLTTSKDGEIHTDDAARWAKHRSAGTTLRGAGVVSNSPDLEVRYAALSSLWL